MTKNPEFERKHSRNPDSGQFVGTGGGGRWAQRIADGIGRVLGDRQERMDAVAQERGINLDPDDSHAIGTRVTDPHDGEGEVTRRYRRDGLEMATVEYDGAPGEPQDWEIVDLSRRE